MDQQKFRQMFLDEAAEHLQQMMDELLLLADDPDNQEKIAALFREAHSIKGMAATMEFNAMARLAHALEDALEGCRTRGMVAPAEVDRFISACDQLEALLEDIRQQRPERSVDSLITSIAEAAETATTGEQETGESSLCRYPIRLRLKSTVAAPGPRFLVILTRLAEIGTILSSSPSEAELLAGDAPQQLSLELQSAVDQETLLNSLQQYTELEDVLLTDEPDRAEPARPAARQTVRVSTELLDHFINLTGELITNRYLLESALRQRDWSELEEGVGQLARLVKNLHHQVLQVRMVPLDSLLRRLSRTLHELTRANGKQILLQSEGTAIELDRAIIEGLVAPLNHMLRNAVDHGIEQQGTISLRAWRERDQVVVQLSDDGRGLDAERIRQTALERGLLTPGQAQALSQSDLYQLICQPGFSTATEVTRTSGRGVGMDVVKTEVEKIGGLLLIDSSPGEGTSVTLRLPLSLAIMRALLVDCDGIQLALPLTRVIQTLEIPAERIQSSGKQLLIPYQGKLLPLLSLRKILRRPKGKRIDPLPVVVTEVVGRRIGLVVDRLLQQREIFIQNLPEPFAQLRSCSGGTILGNGQIVFLLDLQALLEMRRR
jgi:two-component system chemotaxis sensor kinase CheA